jgi:predicted negative regulator of RcsB-dependent stress response
VVNVHLSEEEQVEALKKWWSENGKSVVAGVVLGLGGVFGWQAWTQHQKSVSEEASEMYQALSQSMTMNAFKDAESQAKSLLTQHGGSTYAVFAALDLAKVKLAQGEMAEVKTQLQWVIDNAGVNSLRQVARLRLARVLLGEGDFDAASAVIAQATTDSYRGDFAELRGDIALAKGDAASARASYQEALENEVGNMAVVQMKLNDLAAGS